VMHGAEAMGAAGAGGARGLFATRRLAVGHVAVRTRPTTCSDCRSVVELCQRTRGTMQLLLQCIYYTVTPRDVCCLCALSLGFSSEL